MNIVQSGLLVKMCDLKDIFARKDMIQNRTAYLDFRKLGLNVSWFYAIFFYKRDKVRSEFDCFE